MTLLIIAAILFLIIVAIMLGHNNYQDNNSQRDQQRTQGTRCLWPPPTLNRLHYAAWFWAMAGYTTELTVNTNKGD